MFWLMSSENASHQNREGRDNGSTRSLSPGTCSQGVQRCRLVLTNSLSPSFPFVFSQGCQPMDDVPHIERGLQLVFFGNSFENTQILQS